MSANKFATMLHRNTNRITVILVYVVLEWVLIILLLLNSLFSYLIRKFANYVGLKPPCLWCCRVDHMLEPGESKNSYRDLVCESHATELIKLGYYSNHCKLAGSQNMCQDCLSSLPSGNGKSMEEITFFSWVSENRIDHGKNYRCSCCNERLSSKLYPCLLFNPSWGYLNYNTQKGNLILELVDDDSNGSDDSNLCNSSSMTDDCKFYSREEEDNAKGAGMEHHILNDIANFSFKNLAEEDCLKALSKCQSDEKGNEDKIGTSELSQQFHGDIGRTHHSSNENRFQICNSQDESLDIISGCSKNYNDHDLDRLIPVELIDYSTIASLRSCKSSKKNSVKQERHINSADMCLSAEAPINSFADHMCVSGEAALHKMDEILEKTKAAEKDGAIESERETQINSDAEHMRVSRATVQHIAEDNEEETMSIDHKSVKMAEPANCSAINEAGRVDVADAENCSGPNAEAGKACEQVTPSQAAQTLTADSNVKVATIEELNDPPASEEEIDFKSVEDETKSQVLVGAEVFNHGLADQIQAQEPLVSLANPQEDQPSMCKNSNEICNSPDEHVAKNDHDSNIKATGQEETIPANKNPEGINHLSMHTDANEAGEEKFPETPTSTDGLHHLHKKLMPFEKKEWGTDESLDGSVASEMEGGAGCGGDGGLTTEQLKLALKAKRKALNALYLELEEERSAAAIAANQTMAMITRLQEEKAAMQMEALQYQRMMEEQSEYDQEALQLLNELMIKREKEKQELERELEMYRERVLDYEAKEKIVARRKYASGSRNSSASCSNADDSDKLSIDINIEARDEDNGFFNYQEISDKSTPIDEVLNLDKMGLDCVKHLGAIDESLAEYEQERMSILEQLKALEERLFTLGDDEQFFEDVKPIENLSEYNGKAFDERYSFSSLEENEVVNGFSYDMREKNHPESKIINTKARRLLPLFDAIDIENKKGIATKQQIDCDSNGMQNSFIPNFELENEKFAVEEEVEHIYERLQALEADREFLKHCISSLKKGDKGMDLLQEILQHLRDLRTVELHVRKKDCLLQDN
ncbi:myosin-binding protein 3 isoform X2 [Malania oleifera]|uniref:myosin-binding protein 3 isoform X2 n=1 Tax=Malania oleifera TaxID=397392 RepID=UPI0025ADFFA0|nr:myosin-binding protein 3 isoform X2 [Malania oleifera]